MMEPPIAALLGATVGGLAGLAGPLVGSSIQAVRDIVECARHDFRNR